MTYEIKDKPTEENVQRLIEAAPNVDSEWVTVIRCAHEGGIKTSIGRHLGPSHIFGNEIEIKAALSRGTLRRKLPPALLNYLLHLNRVTTHFCPRLDALNYCAFANSWRSVCKEAGIHIQLLTLTWSYRNQHKEEINWERARSYLSNMATQWLKEDEIQNILVDEKKWLRMGSKSGNRSRRLTRSQILAPFKTGAEGIKLSKIPS